MKPLVAGLLTAVVLAAMLVLGSRRAVTTDPAGRQEIQAPSGVASSPAEVAVKALLKSGEDGDVTAYLASFAGPMKDRLEREVADRGREAFADDLRRAAASRKSHAVFAGEPDGDDVARITVETVYSDRNERQTYRVEKTGDGWRVADVATVKSHQPAAKFGSPASFIAPEGVPVQESTLPKVGLMVEPGDDPDPR
jgi:hypothetical protein